MTIKETRDNHQIQGGSRLLPRKKIPTPGTVLTATVKVAVSDLKRRQWAALKDKNRGYPKLQDITDAPRAADYEPDKEDLDFLSSLFKEDFPVTRPFAHSVFELQVTKDFIKVVNYLEERRDFTFKDLQLTSRKFADSNLERIVAYWKTKTSRTKYPLIRKNWATNIKKPEFGQLDACKVAYRERQDKNEKQMRPNRKQTLEDQIEQVSLINRTLPLLNALRGLEVLREKLKLAQTVLQHNIVEQSYGLKEGLLKGTESEIKEAERLFLEYNPPAPAPLPIPQKHVEEQYLPEVLPSTKVTKQVDNDVAFVVSTIISELESRGFSLADIRMDNLKVINEKIKSLKQKTVVAAQSQVQEHQIGLASRANRVQLPSFDNYVPVKRISYSCALDEFVEKMSESQLNSEMERSHGQNYVFDYKLRENPLLLKMVHENSHFRFNPFMTANVESYQNFCNGRVSGTSAYSNYLNYRNLRAFEEVAFGRDTLEEGIGSSRDWIGSQAKLEVDALNLKSGFQNWKRVKESDSLRR